MSFIAVLLLSLASLTPTASASLPAPVVPIDLSIQSGQPTPPPIFPPIWNSIYDWPAGHGYNTWTANKATALPQGYQLTPGLDGQSGLWIWPSGSPGAGDAKYPPGFVEYVFRAPGTTRIARASIDLSYRPSLYAHHCTDIGLRNSLATLMIDRYCAPPTPGNETIDSGGPVHDRNVALFDPVSSPTATETYIKLEKPVCTSSNQLACLKWIPDNDPRTNGFYLRAKKVSMTLVDDDLPVVTPSGAFYDLDDTYIDGKQVYPLTVDSSDAGAGIFASQFDHTTPTPPASLETLHEKPADCDATHNVLVNEARICPPADSFSLAVDTNPFPEGTNRFRAWAVDPAGNIGQNIWNVHVDRTPPPAPDSLSTDFTYDPDVGTPDPATFIWAPSVDPILADGSAPAGWNHDEVRYSLNDGQFSDWIDNTSHQLVVPDGYPYLKVRIEIRSVDNVGNTSEPARLENVLTSARNPDATSLQQRVESARRVRDDFGLDQPSDETLYSMESNPAFDFSRGEWGLALNPDEYAELEARIEREPEIADIQEYYRDTYPSTFGGIWIDQVHGGPVHVSFTSNAAANTATAPFSRPDLLVPETTSVSRADLLQTYTDVTHDMDDLSASYGTEFTTVTMDEESSRVEVGVDAPSVVSLASIRQQYGPWVVLVESPDRTGLAGRESLGRQRIPGGIDMMLYKSGMPLDEPPFTHCTNGISAVDQSTGEYFLITAQHCQNGDWFTSYPGVWRLDSVYEFLGSTANERILPNKNGKADAQAIKVNHNRTSNAIYTPDYSRRLSRVERMIGVGKKDEVKGQTVFLSGAYTDKIESGKLLNTEFTSNFESHGIKYKFVNQRKTTIDGLPGDSGGIIYRKIRGRRAIAVGIMSYREGDFRLRSAYSHIQHVENALGLLVCLPNRALCGK